MEVNINKIRRSTQHLRELLAGFSDEDCDNVLSQFINKNDYKSEDIEHLFTYISEQLQNPALTMPIAYAFNDQLLLLITRSLHSTHDVDEHNFVTYQRACITLAQLMQQFVDAKRFAIRYFRNKRAPFANPEVRTHLPKKRQRSEGSNVEQRVGEFELVQCLYRLLQSDPDYFKDLWDWSNFVAQYVDGNSTDAFTQLYANHIISIITNMTSIQLSELNARIPVEVKIKFVNDQTVHTVESELQNPPSLVDDLMLSVDLSTEPLTSVEGVLLPIFNKNNSNFYAHTDGAYDKIVKVDATKVNLRSIALGVAASKAICLSGPVGCGKTTLVEYLARKTGRICPKAKEIENQQKFLDKENQEEDNLLIPKNKPERKFSFGGKRKSVQETVVSTQKADNFEANGFLRIQLGDQTDSKVLLGHYRCTDVPGEFLWMPGVLTQAVMNGYWLLLEDLDSATQDTYTILSSLLERNYLSVPGFRDCVKIEPGFQLFVTVRTNKSATNISQKSLYSLLDKYLYTINILPLSRNELCKVVSTNYPKLSTVANRIVDVFLTFSSGNHNAADHLRQQETGDKADTTEKYVALPFEQVSLSAVPNSGRLVSTRDLIKLCQRSNPVFSVTSTECAYFVFQNAVDIFCSYLPQGKEKTTLITSIGAKLGIIQSRCEHFANDYKPEVQMDRERIKVGRATLYAKRISEEDVNEQDTNERLEPQMQKRQKLTQTTEKAILRTTTAKKATFSFTRLASCILERIAVCVSYAEPVLLVGETGVGKTSSVQYLAQRTQHKLVVVNMNNQSDVSDLIGGFKPVELKYVVTPLRNEFELLFRQTFNQQKNEEFLNKFCICFNQGNYSVLLRLMLTICERVFEKSEHKNLETVSRWQALQVKLIKLNNQLAKSINISFAFIPGSLVNCIRNGDWVLLDEINLASAETLECLSTILEPDGSVVLLERGDFTPVKRHPDFRIFACMNPNTDIGKKDLPVGIRNRFTEFFVDELTTDADLCLLVSDYLNETGIQKKCVHSIVKLYKKLKTLSDLELNDGLGNRPVYSLRTLCRSLCICAKNLCGSIERNLYESFCLSFLTQLDPSSHHIVSLLIRDALLTNPKAALKHALPKLGEDYLNFEGYWIQKGPKELEECANYILTDNVKNNLKDLARIISIGKLPILLQGPTSAGKTSLIEYVAKRSGNHCLRINNHEHTDLQEYIGSYAADSTGKLSFKEGMLVQAMRHGYWMILDELNLASTDILEALNRVLDDNRELFIPETQTVVRAHPNFMLFATQNPPGLYGGRKTLSRAFKNRFIELHFADIPRAELETILEKRCQIPPSYARKMVNCMSDLQKNRKTTTKNVFTLRDLFRWGNRYTFADKTFDDPNYDWNQHLIEEGYLVLSAKVRTATEIEIIEDALYRNFKKRINLEELFDAQTSLTNSAVTRKIIQTIREYKQRTDIVWTRNMTRMAVLTAKALQFDEPVLLVGPTGCGKTTVCQLLASINDVELRILNCHMHTEGADFLGGLRPCRSQQDNKEARKLFEWSDGPLVHAMQEGSYFMADEISLAEDSVLERLNCVLEPERTVLLAEKGGVTDVDMSELSKEFVVRANKGFQFLATMNPGGDFGKKELSPALRNRFTEIWCLPSDNKGDLVEIASNCMTNRLKIGQSVAQTRKIAEYLVEIVLHIRDTNNKFKFSIRDILAWANYMVSNSHLSFAEQAIFGLETIFLDAFEMLPHESLAQIESLKTTIKCYAVEKAAEILGIHFNLDNLDASRGQEVTLTPNKFGIKPFFIATNPKCQIQTNANFFFDAPTTKQNLFRLLSSLSLQKPVLLEGPPGVGKTSIVESIAHAIGYEIVRINLCEHTDLADLFGTDLPAEDNALGNASEQSTIDKTNQLGSFAWRDGPLLAALKAENTWILLDELNLAPQSVLEGLNAVLDHRGEVYIPELNKTFMLGKETRIFACQNPLRQGGGRKGLPQSFLNRFNKVYLRKLNTSDLLHVINVKYASYFEQLREHFLSFLSVDSYEYNDLFEIYATNTTSMVTTARDHLKFNLAERLVKFSETLDNGISSMEFGYKGGPYEFNLRDILRWCDLMHSTETGYNLAKKTTHKTEIENFREHFNDFLLTLYERMKLVYYQRMRSEQDKLYIRNVFATVFNCDAEHLNDVSEDVALYWTTEKVYLNDIVLNRAAQPNAHRAPQSDDHSPLFLHSQREIFKQVVESVHMEKPVLLCGATDTGKTKLIDALCQLSNQICNTDSIDDSVTGSFQQIDLNRHLEEISQAVASLLITTTQKIILARGSTEMVAGLLNVWSNYNALSKTKTEFNNSSAVAEELRLYQTRIRKLNDVIHMLKDIPNNYLTTPNFKSVLTQQSQLLAVLKNYVNSAESLNTGGSFEWVDSKIVKSLKCGQYILLEHVNLCSSAVLDRLNSVFEPNGKLLISEKGVAANESAEIVEKAPNFRAFLTIDPKNGELSRAMRNRCVELALTNVTYDVDDMRAIVHSQGVHEIEAIDCILRIHTHICQLTDLNNFTVSHLTQFAFLTDAYKRLGYELKRAIYVSAMEVYVYAASIDLMGYGLGYYQNKLREVVLAQTELFHNDKFNQSEDLLAQTILRCSDLSPSAMIKLQAAPLKVLLPVDEVQQERLVALFQQMAHLDFNQLKPLQLKRFYIYMLYEVSSPADIEMRHIYLQQLFEEQPAAHPLRTLADQLFVSVKAHAPELCGPLAELPWHRKLYPRIRDYNVHLSDNAKQLALSAMLLAQLLVLEIPQLKLGRLTEANALTYSQAVVTKQTTDKFNNEFLNNLFSFVVSLRETLMIVLPQSNFNLEQYSSVVTNYLWFNRFLQITQRKLLKTDKKLNQDLMDKIILHFKWLQKHLMQQLAALLPKYELIHAEYENSRKKLEAFVQNEKHPLNIIRKTYAKQLMQFQPFYQEEQITLFGLSQEMDQVLAVVPFYGSYTKAQILRKFIVQKSNETKKLRALLQAECRNIFDYKFKNSNTNSSKSHNIHEIQTTLQRIQTTENNAPETVLANIEALRTYIQELKQLVNAQDELSIEQQPKEVGLAMISLREYYLAKLITTSLNNQTDINMLYCEELDTLNNDNWQLINVVNSNRHWDLVSACNKLAQQITQFRTVEEFGQIIESLGGSYKELTTYQRLVNRAVLSYQLDNLSTRTRITSIISSEEAEISSNYVYEGPALLNAFTAVIFQQNGQLKPVPLNELDNWRANLWEMRQLMWHNGSLMTPANRVQINNLHCTRRNVKRLLYELDYIQTICDADSNNKSFNEYNAGFRQLTKDLEDTMGELQSIDSATDSYPLIQYTTALANLLIGTLELCLLTFTPLIDPVEKSRLKNEYVNEDIDCLNTLTTVYNFMKIIMKYRHFGDEIYLALKQNLLHAQEKQRQIAQKVALRPSECLYSELVQDVRHFLKTNCEPQVLHNLIVAIQNVWRSLTRTTTATSAELDSCAETLNKIENWLASSQHFVNHILKRYVEYYQDFLQPIKCAVQQTRFGLENLKIVLNQLSNAGNLLETSKVERVLTNLIEFPSAKHLSIYNADVYSLMECLPHSEHDYFCLLKAKLSELYNRITLASAINETSFREYEFALNICNQTWQKEEERRRRQQAEAESLYVNKTRCETEDEELIEQQEIEENFPTHVQEDFGEFVTEPTLERVMKLDKQTDLKAKVAQIIRDEDYAFLAENFINIMTTYTTIAYRQQPHETSVSAELLEPYQLRLGVFVKLYSHYKQSLNDCMDEAAYNGLCIALGLQQQMLNDVDFSQQSTKAYDYYKHSNIPEIISCTDVLNRIEVRVLEQLELYPEHAGLIDIKRVIDRIRLLPSTASVVRFNTGFQLLRQKLSLWNEVAHKMNHLRDEEIEVAEFVQRWTKLELKHWRNCLTQTYESVQSQAYRYWFFIYSLFQQYITQQEVDNSYTEMKYAEKRFANEEVLDAIDAGTKVKVESTDVIRILRQFVEASCYGDFHIRLQLLNAFEMHLQNVAKYSNHNLVDLIAGIHNLQIYFAQFAAEIKESNKSRRTPIEKKLKEFVKIESYNKDLSYFSMRNNVARVHRNLNKFLKEYRQTLLEKITPVFQPKDATVKDYNFANDKGKDLRFDTRIKYYMPDVKFFVASEKLREKYVPTNLEFLRSDGDAVLQKVGKHFVTARNVVKETVTNANYPNLIIAVDMLLVEELERCEHLRNLNVDRSKERPKQKLEAKQILQQKRKALSDLFKTLSELGLNYKTGLLESSLRTDFENLSLPPFCVKTMLGASKEKHLTSNIIQLNENLDMYFAKCVFKLKLLQNIMLTPLSELGPPSIERIKGFAIDMFLLVQNQRELLSNATKQLYDLRMLVQNLKEVSKITLSGADVDPKALNFNVTSHQFQAIKASLCQMKYVFKQFQLLLTCIPTQEDKQHMAQTQVECKLRHGSSYCNAIMLASEKILKVATSTLLDMEKQKSEFLDTIKLENYRETHSQLVIELKKVLAILETTSGAADVEYLPSAQPLLQLLDSVEEMLKTSASVEAEEVPFDVEKIETELSNIVHAVLLALQKIYKKHPKMTQSNENGSLSLKRQNIETQESKAYELQNQHLKQGLYGELNNDWQLMNMPRIISKLDNILLCLKIGQATPEKLNCTRKVITLLPILEQYHLLADYYLLQQLGSHKVSAKMLSVMLTVFIEIGTKGFCVPADLMQDEEGQAKNDQKQGEGFGLEDGTGENDASDKIESEDQLDDAKRPEDRKDDDNKEEQQDCKEEKGIEMSDDFDGKMQDIEKPENEEDDSGESEEEEELNKEMGETEEGAEKLDDQIWGDDEEEEEKEEQELNDEDQGKGSKDEKDAHNDLDTKNDAAKEDGKEEHEKDGLDATNEPSGDDKRKQQEKDINDIKDNEVDEEQTNAYHNELEEPPEPEEMDLGDMKNADEGQEENEEQQGDENPFDIDTMKENMQQIEPEADDDENDGDENDKSGDEKGEGDDSDTEDEDLGTEKRDDKNIEENVDDEQNIQEEQQKEEEEPETQTRGEVDPEQPTNEEEQAKEEEEKRPEKPEQHSQSKDKSSKEENVQSVPETEQNSSADQVQNQEDDVKQEQKMDEQETGEEKDGVGQAENETNDGGHQGIAETKETVSQDERKNERQTQEKRQQGHTNEERTLGEAEQNKLKQLKTIEKLQAEKQSDDGEQEEPQQDVDAEEYQHVKEPKTSDKTTLDNATEEQSKQIQHQEDEEKREEDNETSENPDELMDAEDDATHNQEDDEHLEQLNAEKHEHNKSEKPAKTDQTKERLETPESMEVEGDVVPTMTVERSTDTTAHCNNEIILDKSSHTQELSMSEQIDLRKTYQQQMTSTKMGLPQHDDYETWQTISNRMTQNARELCEQLRLILEPTKCTRLKGDYRTGRRINMKKIIPYIASQFRKDKIWLRRTKPAQRDYKITIAIDDSKSMHHNNSKTLTLEAISLVSQALTLLESGRLSIVSFGEAPQIVLHHTEQFDGPKLVSALNFAQDKTKIAGLLDFIRTVNTEEGALGSENGLFENLLLILSDGRNIFSEGKTKVSNAIKLARLQRIFLVYVIIDNPDNKSSILDVQHMEIALDKSIKIKPYLDVFPFPYYVIVRDLNQLPLVLSEAMRQWFELVNSEQ